MKESYVIGGVVLGTALLIGGGALLAGRMETGAQVERSGEAEAVVSERTRDWGEVPLDGGDVEAEFSIGNEGAAPLRLFNVSTSCMCTTARLVAEGGSSPEFGMHTKSSYVMEVPPGEEASLKVTFDPAYHGPQGRGGVTRQVKVETNDASRPELLFTLKARVI